MKIQKLIYWFSPIIAVLLQVGMFFISDRLRGANISESASGGHLSSETIDFIMTLMRIALVLIGYLVAFLYQWLRFHVGVLVGFVLLFFLIEALQDFPGIYNYDYTREGAVLTVISVCMRGIFLWCSYPAILSGLLYWCAKKLRYALDDDC